MCVSICTMYYINSYVFFYTNTYLYAYILHIYNIQGPVYAYVYAYIYIYIYIYIYVIYITSWISSMIVNRKPSCDQHERDHAWSIYIYIYISV